MGVSREHIAEPQAQQNENFTKLAIELTLLFYIIMMYS